MEGIQLSNVEGMGILSGTDQNGNVWTQFQVDYLAEQLDGECSECGATISEGWLCMDGGEELCNNHVQFEEGETC